MILLIRGVSDEKSTRVGGNARDILDQRYARGEIDRDEFEQKRRDLSD